MNFNPFTDIPTCDVCGAVCAQTQLEVEGQDLMLSLSFACGGQRLSRARRRFGGEFPHGAYAIYDSGFREWQDTRQCRNASEIVRRLRKEGGDA